MIFSAEELCEIFGKQINDDVFGIAIDSRNVKSGDIFIAIHGEKFDGHGFLNSAFENGCKLAVVSDLEKVDSKYKNKIIHVDDTVNALQCLGSFARNRCKSKIIGVTGSVGKTTTREMLHHILSSRYNSFSSIKNYNGQIGLPICLCMIPKNSEISILEMGMSASGEIKKLVKISNPTASVITSVSESHCTFFSDIKEIAKAKSEIFSNGKNQDFSIIPFDSEYHEFLKNKAHEYGVRNVYSFGIKSKNSDAYIVDIYQENYCTFVEANILGETVSYKLQSLNFGFLSNSLASILITKLMGVELRDAAISLEIFSPIMGRGNVITLNNDSILIDDSYNASPSSMYAAINALGAYKNKNKIAILGDMGELGRDEILFHQQLSKHINNNAINILYLCGENMKFLYQKIPDKSIWFKDINSLIKDLNICDNSAILVKASRFMQFDKITNHIVCSSKKA